MVRRRFVKQIINFGTSLGIVLDKCIKETLNLEKGDRIVFDVVRIIKKRNTDDIDNKEK